MKSIECEMLSAPPEQGPDCELVHRLNYLLVHFKFQPGKTTRKSRKRIIHAIVRTAKSTKFDADGNMEEDQFGIVIGSDIVPNELIEKITKAIKDLPDVNFGVYKFSIGLGDLYLMSKRGG